MSVYTSTFIVAIYRILIDSINKRNSDTILPMAVERTSCEMHLRQFFLFSKNK